MTPTQNTSIMYCLGRMEYIELELTKHHVIPLLVQHHVICHKNIGCLYHRCLHFQSFLSTPKDKYYWQALTLLVFATSLQKTQLVTNRHIVSTNATSNQQGRLRIEPPTSTCRQDIRACFGLTPRVPVPNYLGFWDRKMIVKEHLCLYHNLISSLKASRRQARNTGS